MRRAVAALGLALSWLTLPAVAHATWPGRDGMLAVQPVRGGGILLVTPRGRIVRRVCPSQVSRGCEVAPSPSWSPDGRRLVFGSLADGLEIVYADGTCMDCRVASTSSLNTLGSPVFDAGGHALVFASNTSMWGVPEDGVGVDPASGDPGKLLRIGAGGIDPAVSIDRRIAFVRRTHGRERVFLSNRSRTRSVALAAGSSPSWSPDGRSLAFANAGSIWTIPVDGATIPHRLARGSDPVYSPDGHLIAFLDARGDPSMIPAAGGRTRQIGAIPARHLDWQPIVAGPPRCNPPPGSRTVFVGGALTVTQRSDQFGEHAYMTCWRPRGLLRLIEDAWNDSYGPLRLPFDFVAAGHELAFQERSMGLDNGPSSYDVLGFDLARGELFSDATGEVGRDAACCFTPTFVGTAFAVDQLLVSPAGTVAWLSHATGYTSDTTVSTTTSTTPTATATTQTSSTFNSSPFTTYEVIVHDAAGKRVLDSATPTGPSAPLSDLQLSDSTVSWLHNGQQSSAPVDGEAHHRAAR